MCSQCLSFGIFFDLNEISNEENESLNMHFEFEFQNWSS